MKNSFSYSEKNVSLEDINEFQQNYNIKLPESYKQHILINNGGIPKKDFLKEKEITVSCFYSIKYGENKIEDIIKNLQVLEDVLPKNLFPFANDLGGNDFCISLEENNFGKIYIWYHDTGGEKKFIADSFQEFMNDLVEN